MAQYQDYQGIRRHFPILEDWRFSDCAPADFFQKDYDDASWRSLTLPHDYSMEHGFSKDNPSSLTGGYCKVGLGYYRKHFFLPKEDQGKHVTLTFDGVSMNSKVYVNGGFWGVSHYPFSAFERDITPYVAFGEDNVIAVMVDCSVAPYSRFYIGMGIFRKVFLTLTQDLRIENRGSTPGPSLWTRGRLRWR